MEDRPEQAKKPTKLSGVVLGIIFGTSFGVLLGVIFFPDQLAIFISLGAAVGITMGAIIDARRRQEHVQ